MSDNPSITLQPRVKTTAQTFRAPRSLLEVQGAPYFRETTKIGSNVQTPSQLNHFEPIRFEKRNIQTSGDTSNMTRSLYGHNTDEGRSNFFVTAKFGKKPLLPMLETAAGSLFPREGSVRNGYSSKNEHLSAQQRLASSHSNRVCIDRFIFDYPVTSLIKPEGSRTTKNTDARASARSNSERPNTTLSKQRLVHDDEKAYDASMGNRMAPIVRMMTKENAKKIFDTFRSRDTAKDTKIHLHSLFEPTNIDLTSKKTEHLKRMATKRASDRWSLRSLKSFQEVRGMESRVQSLRHLNKQRMKIDPNAKMVYLVVNIVNSSNINARNHIKYAFLPRKRKELKPHEIALSEFENFIASIQKALQLTEKYRSLYLCDGTKLESMYAIPDNEDTMFICNNFAFKGLFEPDMNGNFRHAIIINDLKNAKMNYMRMHPGVILQGFRSQSQQDAPWNNLEDMYKDIYAPIVKNIVSIFDHEYKYDHEKMKDLARKVQATQKGVQHGDEIPVSPTHKPGSANFNVARILASPKNEESARYMNQEDLRLSKEKVSNLANLKAYFNAEGSLTTSNKGMKLRKIENYYENELPDDDDDDETTKGKEEGTFANPEDVNKVVSNELRQLIPALLKIAHITRELEQAQPTTGRNNKPLEQVVKIMENEAKKEGKRKRMRVLS